MSRLSYWAKLAMTEAIISPWGVEVGEFQWSVHGEVERYERPALLV